jgi:ABC-type antimicrobial peptide transport system permease subunit
MRGLPSVSRVVVHSEIENDLGGLLAQTMGMLYFFFVLNLLLTIAVAGSAVIISSMERDLEYATLDTLGVSRRGVVKAIIIEMGVLALLSAVAAVPLAYALAEVMALVMADVLFLIPIIFVLGATVLTVAIGAAFVMLSSFVPIRYAAGLDTGRAIRERTVA